MRDLTMPLGHMVKHFAKCVEATWLERQRVDTRRNCALLSADNVEYHTTNTFEDSKLLGGA